MSSHWDRFEWDCRQNQLEYFMPFYEMPEGGERVVPMLPIRVEDTDVVELDLTVRPPSERCFKFSCLVSESRIWCPAGWPSGDDAFKAEERAKARVRSHFWRLVERGDSNRSHEFDGLTKLVAPERTIDLEFEPLTLDVLVRAGTLITALSAQTVICTNLVGVEAIRATCFENGFAPELEEVSAPNGAEPMPMLIQKVAGMCVLRNDFVQTLDRPAGELRSRNTHEVEPDQLTREMFRRRNALAANIWFLSLGLYGLHGIVPEGTLGPDGPTIHTRLKVNPIDDEAGNAVYESSLVAGIGLGHPGAIAVIRNARIPEPVRIEP